MGSSLKLCCIAEGKADIYPRLGPTSEWDIGAAQCVVEEAGGTVLEFDTNNRLSYNKENILNPFFIVSAYIVLLSIIFVGILSCVYLTSSGGEAFSLRKDVWWR